MSDAIARAMEAHYSRCFTEHGPTARGVDWGPENDVRLRYDNMLAVIESGHQAPVRLLDVGCGYGGLLRHANERGIALDYTGIDVCEDMIAYARKEWAEATFLVGDVMTFEPESRFDYVVCNGILTQRLSATIIEMDEFAKRLIKRMFSLSSRGSAFNVMTSRVNFMVDNLYYKNPVELFAYCFTEVTGKIRLDHAYPLYEYTLYLYREDT